MTAGLLSCSDPGKSSVTDVSRLKQNTIRSSPEIPFCYEGITELRRGDIIVKPNLNILPGTSRIPNGYLFGHAALVIKGAQNENPDSLLAQVRIVESIGRDVPRAFQVREIAGYVVNSWPALNNTNFGPAFRERRYRLRLNLRESQIDSIVQFALKQKNDYSTWPATKSFPGNPATDSLVRLGYKENWADNSQWYCSLLIWQSFLFVTGIDLDPNGGYRVYPNDLIKSPFFNNTPDGQQHRVRF
ncbi:MAG: hypothetical protein WCI71_07820 [Bacteroidota bacterium]